LLSFAHDGIGWRGRRRRLLLIASVRVRDPEIMVGVLTEIFSRHAVVGGCGIARECDVALEYLMGAAADPDVRAVAIECVIALRCSRLLLDWPVTVIAAVRRTLA
jgi:hypothetical protein